MKEGRGRNQVDGERERSGPRHGGGHFERSRRELSQVRLENSMNFKPPDAKYSQSRSTKHQYGPSSNKKAVNITTLSKNIKNIERIVMEGTKFLPPLVSEERQRAGKRMNGGNHGEEQRAPREDLAVHADLHPFTMQNTPTYSQ